MTKYEVTIVRTITTVISVEDVCLSAAKHQIENYGIAEAVSDYDVEAEDVSARIKSMKVCK